MSVNPTAVQDIVDALVTRVQLLGIFETVNTHEPKTAPGNGLRCSIWANSIKPLPTASGLNTTSVLVTFMSRIFSSMLAEPQDAIDPGMVNASLLLMDAYNEDFGLSGITTADIRNVDLLGQFSDGLASQAGYLNIDGKMYRVMDVILPVIINDIFNQEA